ncbi:MAG: hypothetical protein ABIH42_07475 [Planctomycetota bacterium]
MESIINFIKSFHDNAVEWCRGRLWHPRLLVLIWFVYILVNHLIDDKYQSLFGYLNLGIHELGHFVFALFGEFIGILGGSLLQCLVPVISVYMFWRMHDYFGITFCFGWLSTNFFYVATYVADARAMALPLVSPGGGYVIHDWNYLLSRLGILDMDTTLAFLLRFAAVVSMFIFYIAGGYLLYRMFTLKGKLPFPED